MARRIVVWPHFFVWWANFSQTYDTANPWLRQTIVVPDTTLGNKAALQHPYTFLNLRYTYK